MTKWSLMAMVLIAIDHHRGQWCALEWIAQRVMSPLEDVRRQCEELVAAAQLHAAVFDGRQYFGAHFEAGVEPGRVE